MSLCSKTQNQRDEVGRTMAVHCFMRRPLARMNMRSLEGRVLCFRVLLQRLHAGEAPAPDRLAERDMQRALSGLPSAPLWIAVSTPMRLPLNSPLGLLLSNQRAMAMAVTEAEGEQLGLHVTFVGEFQPERRQTFVNG